MGGEFETELTRQKDKFIDDNGNFKGPDGQLWPAGVFEQPSIADLKKQLEAMPHVRSSETVCPLNLVDGVDIGKYQACLKSEDCAMVQIASNFHCLENASPDTSADSGGLVSSYAFDTTQGPAAAFGVPAASLLRAHYAFKVDGRDPAMWGQSAERQINLIEDICVEPDNYCGDCVNGKARLKGGEKPVSPELIDDVASKVKVGLHSDAQVVFSRGSKRGTISVVDSPQFVDQVCSSTLCYGFANLLHDPPEAQLHNLTAALLRAAYEGAYLSAIVRRRKILLLTLIGGHCFGNPEELIVRELKRAHDLFASHPASQLQKVELVLYHANSARRYQELLEQ